MNRLYVPTTSPGDWQRLLRHWQRGFCARALGCCRGTEGFPEEVKHLLRPRFPGLEPLLALPEHKTPRLGHVPFIYGWT